MNIENEKRVTYLIDNYIAVNSEYDKVSEELIKIKDVLVDLEFKRIKLREQLSDLRLYELQFIKDMTDNNPEDLKELKSRINNSIVNKMINNE